MAAIVSWRDPNATGITCYECNCLLISLVMQIFKLSIAGLQAENMASQPKNENQQATSSTQPILKTEEDQVASGPSALGLKDSLEKQYLKMKEHAETYPYVWASYIVVYGGFALWTGYRWRKLRKTETRVRTLQERLRKLVEAEEAATSTKAVEKGSTSSEKPSK
ncbi:hypothetical protein RIF29_29376 [Crotalaria pallida]|uniref:Transmembrane protein n=1 Tax=Crotalaria pallida TaxID=3830 RepID=A0AAN9EEF1_CROPI